jgi:RimJ/RimL family protein N-acetyltransferase
MEEMEAEYVTPDGIRLSVRPLRPSDEEGWIEFVNNLSPDSSYHRFFEVIRKVSHQEAGHYLDIDQKERMALVASVSDAKGDRIVGIARYELVPNTEEAEFAVVVADDMQDKGIGMVLLHRLSMFAESKGINGFVAEVLQDNERMMDVFRNSGLRMETKRDAGTWIVKLHFR